MAYVKRNCDYCGNEYDADERNLKRGWGLCCSKSCAAHKRERSRPDYDPEKVERNNLIREGKSTEQYDLYGFDYGDPGDSEYWEGK